MKIPGPAAHVAWAREDRAAVSDGLGLTRVWDLITAGGRHLLVDPGSSRDSHILPGSPWLATAGEGGKATLWEVSTGRIRRRFAHGVSLRRVRLSPDTRWLATAGRTGPVLLWNTATGRLIRRLDLQGMEASSLWFSPDSERLLVATSECRNLLFAVAQGRRMQVLPTDGPISEVLFTSRSGPFFIRTADSEFRAWGPWGNWPWSPTRLATGNAYCARTDIGGSWLAIGVGDGSIQHWRPALQVNPSLWKVHNGPVTSLERSADHKLLVTSSEDRTARVWEASSGRPQSPPLVHADPVRHAALSPDGTLVVTTTMRGHVQVWEKASGALVIPSIRLAPYPGVTYFSAGGTQLITSLENGSAYLIPIQADPSSLDELRALSRLLTGEKRSVEGAPEPADAAGQLRDWREHKSSLVRSSAGRATLPLPHWLEAADRAEAGRRWDAAVRSLTHALRAAGPELHRDLLARRGQACAELGRFSEAARDYSRVVALGDRRPHLLHTSILSHLAAGDVQGYTRLCKLALEQLDREPKARLDLATWNCVLGPVPPTLAREAETRLRQALPNTAEPSDLLANLAGVLLRAGDLAGAEASMQQSLDARRRAAGEPTPVDLLLQALIRARKGDAVGARACRAAALPAIDRQLSPESEGDWQSRVELRLLLRELEAALGSNSRN